MRVVSAKNTLPIVKIAAPGLFQDGSLVVALEGIATVEPYLEGRSLVDQVSEASVLVTRDLPVSAEVIDSAPKLKLIQRAGRHVYNVDIDYARARGIPVCNIPGVAHPSAVPEQALCLLLAVAKRLKDCEAAVLARTVGSPTTEGLSGKTMGFIGIGQTGLPLVRMVKAIGMQVLAVKQTADETVKSNLGLEWLSTMKDLDYLLEHSDVISLHLPVTNETQRILGEREFGLMKTGVILINIARAELVDKFALLDALRSGRLGGAGLDVTWEEPIDPADELLTFANVVVTPHVAGCTSEGRLRIAGAVADNVTRALQGDAIQYRVN